MGRNDLVVKPHLSHPDELLSSSDAEELGHGKYEPDRFLSATLPVQLLQIALLIAFAVQLFVVGRARTIDLAFSLDAFKAGRWWTILTAMFLHAGVFHVLMNVSALAIGEEVYRRFGRSLRGWTAFIGVYFACGLVGWFAFAILAPHSSVPAVGASGAIFGLWGALARLGTDGAPLAPLFSKQVLTHLKQAVIQNVAFIALFFILGLLSSGHALKLAWEAHLGGFLAGLVLIAPALRFCERSGKFGQPQSRGVPFTEAKGTP